MVNGSIEKIINLVGLWLTNFYFNKKNLQMIKVFTKKYFLLIHLGHRLLPLLLLHHSPPNQNQFRSTPRLEFR